MKGIRAVWRQALAPARQEPNVSRAAMDVFGSSKEPSGAPKKARVVVDRVSSISSLVVVDRVSLIFLFVVVDRVSFISFLMVFDRVHFPFCVI